MAYVSHSLVSKNIKFLSAFKTIEILANEMNISGKESLVLGKYRPPKSNGEDYFLRLENELNALFMWFPMLKYLVQWMWAI